MPSLHPRGAAETGLHAVRAHVLGEIRSRQRDSLDGLVALVYDELRAVAHRQLRGRRHAGRLETIATTALVNEAYIKLVDQSRANWQDRAHFLAVAAVAMRQILIDRARARLTKKRGGAQAPVTLDDSGPDAASTGSDPETLLAIDDAIEQLERVSERRAQVVVYRFYGGLSEDEIAEVFGVTVRTVRREWAKGRAFLRWALGAADG